MTASVAKARVVRVKRQESKVGLFIATSPDLKGLLVAEPTLDALDRAIPAAIAELYAALGQPVVVARAEQPDDAMKAWVAFPAEVARRALEDEAAGHPG